MGERPPERFAGMPTRRSRLLQYLPTIFWENDFLGRFLLIPEDMLAPEQEIIDNFDLFLDPMTAPESFLPWLNEWLGGIADETWPTEVQRKVLREASWLYQHRGTYAGLEHYLRLATDCEPEIMENVDGAFSFRVILHTGGKPADQRMVESIIEFNRPAHTVYTLEIDTSKPPEPPEPSEGGEAESGPAEAGEPQAETVEGPEPTESSQADESSPDEGSVDSAETEGTPSDTE
jgi:phage tail-like protein